MAKSLEQANELLRSWGATIAQCNTAFPTTADQIESDTRINTLFSIQESLELLFNDDKQRQGFMTSTHKNIFDNHKPLSLIANGKLDDLIEVQRQIRSLVCI